MSLIAAAFAVVTSWLLLGDALVVLSPDHSIDASLTRYGAQPRDKGHEEQHDRQRHHETPDENVSVAARVEGRDLVPEGVQPQPGLAGVVARLVHHAPLITREVLLLGMVRQVAAVGQEQKRQREVCGVKTRLRDERLVQRARAGHRSEEHTSEL